MPKRSPPPITAPPATNPEFVNNVLSLFSDSVLFVVIGVVFGVGAGGGLGLG